MEDCHIVFAQATIFDAKRIAHERILAYVADHPGTLQENVEKAQKAINACATIRKLGEMIASFVLAHDSENLKVIK
jgi:thiamine biosynthesis protein ThiC